MSSHIAPKGTAFDITSSELSVMSYNILAPIFVRPIDSRTGKVALFICSPSMILIRNVSRYKILLLSSGLNQQMRSR